MVGRIKKAWWLSCILFLLSLSVCCAETALDSTAELDTEHHRGVELARAGHHNEALALLNGLLKKYPHYYPVERDIIIVTAWQGDCRAVIRGYERIHDYPDLEPYLILPVSECLVRLDRHNEALALLEEGTKHWPDDSSLLTAYAAAASRASQYLNELRLEVNTDTSDQGKREWLWSGMFTRALADRTHVYLRYVSSRSSYEQYQSGKTDRLGVGIHYGFLVNFILTQEFSGDIHRGGQNGSMTSLVYQPNDSWRLGLTHTNFAEDLPLRAKAQLIEANRNYGFVDFHTLNYRWSWFASTVRYDFSDSNTRNAVFSSVGYAYELTPKREQRFYLEFYGSSNTLADTVYFNPSQDKSISVVHKTDYVFSSRFRRHVDHLYLSVGQYNQQGFSSHNTWDMRYVQDYDFNKHTALAWGLGYGRHVYDGAHEYEASITATYRFLF